MTTHVPDRVAVPTSFATDVGDQAFVRFGVVGCAFGAKTVDVFPVRTV